MRKIVILLLISMACCLPLRAQNSTQGKEFWFTFMQNGYKNNGAGWVSNRVMVSSKKACTGTISKNNVVEFDFSVEANGIAIIDIPEDFAYNENNEETPDNKSLVLEASDTVSVYICNIANYSFDASFVLPVESLGSEYIIQAGTQSYGSAFGDQQTSCFAIVAVEDHTEVDITPSMATMYSEAWVTRTVTLSKGQTYFVRSRFEGENRDLSGSKVVAHGGKKIAVFNGNTLTCIPSNLNNGLDHIFEQALPVSSWGRQFAITSSKSRYRDFVKITSLTHNNQIQLNGNVVAILDTGDSYEFNLMGSEGSCFVETSEPSMVYLYNTTGSEPLEPLGTNGDPSMVWIPPVEQRIEEITFCTFNHDDATIDSHYVNIVVESQDVDKVYLDGVPIPADQFLPVAGNENYSYVQQEISHDTHHLSCISGLTAHVYGFGLAKGYAYCVGANVINLTTQLYVNGAWSGSYHHGLFMCVGESAEFSVVTNYPIEQVDWDFDNGQSAVGQTTSYHYDQIGDYDVKAFIHGFNNLSQEEVFDTLTMDVHVGEPEYHSETHVLCNEDSFDFYGVQYTESGYYERVGTNIFGCDSAYYLTLEMGFSPDFDFKGTHWPIGGSETHISVNDYELELIDDRAQVDTVLWEIDCPNWYVEPHGKGMSCTLYIFTYLLDSVMLHAWAINSCDTIHKEFFIKTSYYDLPEHEQLGFEVVPNPTRGKMELVFNGVQGVVEVSLYNSLGRQVDVLTVDANQYPRMTYVMPELDKGLYCLMMRCNDAVVVRKVLLMR